jgi:hypothetical protein
MRLTLHTLALVAAIIATTAPARADDRADMERFMADYLERWNAHDASAITTRFYRLDGNHPWSTEAGMRAEFDRLKLQGYTVSDIHGIVGCSLGPDSGQVELRFTRLTSDGGFMPPKDRTSLYKLRRFGDGWRVTGMSALPAGTRMECPSS